MMSVRKGGLYKGSSRMLATTQSRQSNSLKVMEVFQPEAVVVCGGADSLSGTGWAVSSCIHACHVTWVKMREQFSCPLPESDGGISARGHCGVWRSRFDRLGCFNLHLCLSSDISEDERMTSPFCPLPEGDGGVSTRGHCGVRRSRLSVWRQAGLFQPEP